MTTIEATGRGTMITHCQNKGCEAQLSTPGKLIGGIPVGNFCPACYANREDEYRSIHGSEFTTPEERLRRRWDQFMVEFPDYAETDTTFLWPTQYKEAMAWYPRNPEGKGLLLTGKSGAGKSRTLFQVMERCLDYQIFPTYYPAEGLARKISDSWNRRGALEILVNDLIRTPVLVLDDLGQERLTARVEESWYAIIRGRCENRKPLLLTTMYDDQVLAQRFTNNLEQGLAIVRRLREYTTPIPFPTPLPLYNKQQELAI